MPRTKENETSNMPHNRSKMCDTQGRRHVGIITLGLHRPPTSTTPAPHTSIQNTSPRAPQNGTRTCYNASPTLDGTHPTNASPRHSALRRPDSRMRCSFRHLGMTAVPRFTPYLSNTCPPDTPCVVAICAIRGFAENLCLPKGSRRHAPDLHRKVS